MTESPCTYLEWDSKFFDCRIARLNAMRLDQGLVERVLRWCSEHGIDCLYFLADSDHAETARVAESNEFQFVDVRASYERALRADDNGKSMREVRFAREGDLKTLRAIARSSHHDSRFYFDTHFERSKCDLLYETWIENSFRGFAQAVLVADCDGEPAGYLTCHRDGSESKIGLVGVSGDHQGKGLGSLLVRSFLAWSQEQGTVRAKVVTQGRNVAAQRLYEKAGFLMASQQLWYHRWFQR